MRCSYCLNVMVTLAKSCKFDITVSMLWRCCELDIVISTLQQRFQYKIYSILSVALTIVLWGTVGVTLKFWRYDINVARTLCIGFITLPQLCHSVVSLLGITCPNLLTQKFSSIRKCNSTFLCFISTVPCCLTHFISNIWRLFFCQ